MEDERYTKHPLEELTAVHSCWSCGAKAYAQRFKYVDAKDESGKPLKFLHLFFKCSKCDKTIKNSFKFEWQEG